LIKESFSCDTPFVVHWDGKILPDLTGSDHVDRLPVLVSGLNVSKLLGVPKLPAGTGPEMANAVVACLDDWQIKNQIKGMSFDTTSSNTGHKAGACTLIESVLGRELLNLACRHHVMEIVAEKVFAVCGIPSTGPTILLFKRFKDNWKSIDQKQIEVCQDNISNKEDIVHFCMQQLTISQPRDDYRELLEITIIYLGQSPARGIRFMRPGALHRARWMARVIYAIKICLFQSQFKMTQREKSGMKRFAAFAVSLYVRSWFLASVSTAAPASDLWFLKQVVQYEDQAIREAAIKAFSRHLWYLNEILVSLAFFDPETSLQDKRDMVRALNTVGSENAPKRIELGVSAARMADKTLADFVTSTSRRFFQLLGIPADFLAIDPEQWDNRDDFLSASAVARSLTVVNDSAERAVALMQTFNPVLTKNEEQKQFLLQVMEEHQKNIQMPRKAQ
jgi:hypothetical protein